ncbi:hypothetical protein A9P82_08300 [Arachidicoccus ginsenosidimutans]|nr:hypothetical protein A9P82_08300 [Arachidicoccus sp. BS20]
MRGDVYKNRKQQRRYFVFIAALFYCQTGELISHKGTKMQARFLIESTEDKRHGANYGFGIANPEQRREQQAHHDQLRLFMVRGDTNHGI